MTAATATLLPAGDWDTITNLCFDRKVAQLGIGSGDQVVTVARVCRTVTLLPGYAEMDAEHRAAVLADLYHQVDSAGVWASVIVHATEWAAIVPLYMGKVFDTVIVVGDRLGIELGRASVEAAASLARTVVVIAPPAADVFDVVTAACPRPSWAVTGSGRLVVAREIFPVKIETREEEV